MTKVNLHLPVFFSAVKFDEANDKPVVVRKAILYKDIVSIEEYGGTDLDEIVAPKTVIDTEYEAGIVVLANFRVVFENWCIYKRWEHNNNQGFTFNLMDN